MSEFFIMVALIVIRTMDVVLLIYVLMSWFTSPYHPFRQGLGRILEPFLAPIRNMMPQSGMMDFSPIVLFIILFIIESLLISLM
ncbi:MAG TPA: YggT family protein [Anaerolineales bacterium]|nr:YggT family protein [Anaerolineales bacterium]